MSRRLGGFPAVVTLGLAAIALMTVSLPSWPATPGPAAPQEPSLEQTLRLDASADRVAPQPRDRRAVVSVPSPTPTDEPTARPIAALVPVAIVAPVAAAPRLAQSVAPPQPSACPADFFCYPRLGVAAAIVPYNDCSGRTDVGAAIRQLTCVTRGIWLAGHAYTQFGGITGFRIGDAVFVRAQRFEITGSIVQQACAPSTAAIAPLSLQTSLDSAACGRVLVVQGRQAP